MMMAKKHDQDRRKGKIPEQDKKNNLLNALGGLDGLKAPHIRISVSSKPADKLPSKEKPTIEEQISKLPEFARSNAFFYQIAFTMLEKDGYTKKSFSDACRKHYNKYDKERITFEKLEEIFKEMMSEGKFANLLEYIKQQQSYNHEFENVKLEESEYHTAFSMYEEARQYLLSSGVSTENPEIEKEILKDVSEISKRLIEFFREQECVNNWDSNKFVRLLLASYMNFMASLRDEAFRNDRIGISDTNSINQFSYAISSIICNVYNEIITQAPRDEHQKIYKRIHDIKSKPIFQYKGAGFDSENRVFNNVNLGRSGYSILYMFLTTYNDKLHLVSEIDQIRKIDWVRFPPFNPKRENLKIPKGDFVIQYCNEESSPELYLCYRGRTGEMSVACYDNTVTNKNHLVCYSVTRNKYKAYPLDSHLVFYISDIDQVGSSLQDSYISIENQEWFREVSDIGLSLKYNGLQLISNIEKVFPGVFDQAYNMDPIEIEVDQDESRLKIISSRAFLDRNMGVFDITRDTVFSRKNGLFEGRYYERQNVPAVYRHFDIDRKNINDAKNFEYINDDTAIVLEFPLSYFIDGVTDREVEETPEEIEQKIYDWGLISKHFSNRSKNNFTYDEFLELIRLDGEITINETSGKGSHYKLFQVNGNGRFLTISNRKRHKGFYLIDLKSALLTLDIDFHDFFEKIKG